MITVAIRFWEPCRVIYNIVLAVIVLGHGYEVHFNHLFFTSVNGFLVLFLMAVLANVVYCAAYIADIFVQWSGFRQAWFKLRWLLLLLGIIFAAVITHLLLSNPYLD